MASKNLALWIVAPLLAACQSGTEPVAQEDWRQHYMVDQIALVKLGFWVRQGKEAAVPAAHGHPCGAVVTRSHSRIPNLQDGSNLELSRAREVNGRGSTIAEWLLPPDYGVRAVAGDWVLIDDYGDLIWISRDGQIRRARGIPNSWQPWKGRDCSSQIPTKYGEEYCQGIVDISTRRERLLMVETVCS